MFSPLEQFDVILIYRLFLWPHTYRILNIMFPLIFMILIVFFFIKTYGSEWKLIPFPFQRLFELLFGFILNLIKQQIGKEGYVYFPLIFIFFNFILSLNLLSLLPFGIALTSHIIVII